MEYCARTLQQNNFDRLIKKINTYYPAIAKKIQKKMALLLVNALEKMQVDLTKPIDRVQMIQQSEARNVIDLICANNLEKMLKSRYLNAAQKHQLKILFPNVQIESDSKASKPTVQKLRAVKKDTEATPLLASNGLRTNPLYDLNAALPAQPTAEDLQHTIRETFAEEPPRHLWFNYFFRSCFPRTTTKKPSTDYVKKVANAMQSVNDFFDACSQKMQGPILRAENSVVQSIQQVFPDMQLDWLFGDVKQRMDEFNRQQQEMELHHVLCIDGNEPSIFSVFYYFIDRSLRLLSIDEVLKSKLCVAMATVDIKINSEIEFTDLNDLIRGLAISQDKLQFSSQQQLHVLDVMFSTLFKHFHSMQNEKPSAEIDILLRTICMHWWEICRVSPKDVLRHFYQELTTIKSTGIASVQHFELHQMFVCMKPAYTALAEDLPKETSEEKEGLRQGLKLVIANEGRKHSASMPRL
jgi:hypothetical protein